MGSITGIFCGPYAHAMNAEVETKTTEVFSTSRVFITDLTQVPPPLTGEELLFCKRFFMDKRRCLIA